ncbi:MULTISPECIES: hypothetical protein [unclassified Streptomyces]|uniref:hypothetical protein n=1 Tax=unclassified Streptomyces TaxID=2593676 RepID=UPI0006F31B62|nr:MULTISPECIES: hypothetical protein [unclassified Streptomyces]KQX53002.1 hypothetical protein ASD33_07145 [Streptomyces sp. Root1304]KRA89921.1 hypothetical protein ASE09_07155 [Streptomyces sp. Root66D1]
MRSRSTLGTVAVLAGGIAAASLAFAPTAAAVSPGSATATYDCGSWGGGTATLTATQSGTSATITVTSAVTTPIAVGADTISSTLTLAKAGGGTRVFTGKKNPALGAGQSVVMGPLSGTVASGDSLNSYFAGVALKMVIFGVTVNCDAVTSQSPGPFVFS